MHYFYVEPEVAGGLGFDTVMDRSVHPLVVSRLHYEMDGWLGDAILESFPCFIVTEDAKRQLQAIGATGANFEDVRITRSSQFRELYPNRELPTFYWLKVSGRVGEDDVGTAADGRLVVSDRVLKALQGVGVDNALIKPLA